MKLHLALLLFAAVYLAVDAQYYGYAPSYYGGYQDYEYPVSSYEDSYEVEPRYLEPRYLIEPRYYGEPRYLIREPRSKGNKGKKKGGNKKGGFWYYWGPQTKHVGWGKGGHGGGHGGHGGGGQGGGGYGGGGYGGGGYGGGGGLGGGGGGGYGGGGYGGGGFGGGGGGGGGQGGGGGWGWKPVRKHIHHHTPHFPHGGPPTIIKHAPVHVHHQQGWGWKK